MTCLGAAWVRVNQGPWSLGKGHYSEPVYNQNGTPTREFKRRFGILVDQIVSAWAKTIAQVPFLKLNYSNSVGNGFYKFDETKFPCLSNQKLLDLDARNHDVVGYDTVG